ncbi:sodium/proline symporter [Halomonas daqiaonensis]|uniref:Sodium/proline symporter n=1 Tax=Halomonas daqiaonensis TaxID=650850 RepID=A0A1H7M4T8_9GAMM|nr:sodium/proline symporter [Halomonas daqiaonensis]SEL06266.1 sodium/proline symporter [Halomonas daqiaonensis]
MPMLQGSFIFFMLVFLLIGFSSVLVRRKESTDYLLAGRNLPPSLAGLSAVATNNSGYMFIGVIGYTYSSGMAAIWLMIGWIVGDFLISLVVHRRLRRATGSFDSLTYPTLLGNWFGQNQVGVRVVTALIAVVFLGIYAAAQFSAGSKALNVLFGWQQWLGVVMGATMVLFYCFSGGLRASVWTDAAQSSVMLLGMGLMVWITVSEQGGVQPSWEALNAVSATYMNWFPTDLAFGGLGPLLFVIGWLFAGIGVIGQPQIMVRFMSLDSEHSMRRARYYYYGWFTAFYSLAMLVGLMSRLLLPDIADFDVQQDTELALPVMAAELLPGILAGLVLAGLFAATISTADSLILTCSAAISRDLLPKRWHSYATTRVATLVMIVLALLIALYSNETVFWLVLHAWSGLGAAFAPLLIVYTLGRCPPQWLTISMVVTGPAVVLLYQLLDPRLVGTVYEILPGMLAGGLAYALGSFVVRLRHGKAALRAAQNADRR